MAYITNVSTNILRDKFKEIDYIVTPNAKEIYDRIFVNNYSEQRSFNLIGNYGTGKSTFIWALEKHLNKEKLFFGNVANDINNEGFEFLKIIGESDSLVQVIGKGLRLRGKIDSTKILNILERKRIKASKLDKGLVLVVDEFGKLLEYASKNNKTEELYLLQQISEWANDKTKNVYFVITLHQSFISYSKNLNSQDKLEWEKVKGRFADLLFNEPVEQLIFFASKRLTTFHIPNGLLERFQELRQLIKESNLISNISIEDDSLSKSLYPLDWLSANVLVKSLQRYGQNERSLFSFLNDDSSYSIKGFAKEFYSISNVYDYLLNAIPSEISSPDNPHRPQWHSTFRALERSELLFKEDYLLAAEVIKTIGLVNIFAKTGGLFNDDFLLHYFKLTRGQDITQILDRLAKAGIIRFYRHSNKINFLEGTDLDLEQELISISRQLNPNFSIAHEIDALVELPILLVKKYSFEIGTPRFFAFRIISDLSFVKEAVGVTDGYINLIFDDSNKNSIKSFSKDCRSNVFVLYNNLSEIKDVVFTIKKFDLLLDKHESDRNAVNLLNQERLFYINKLNDLVVKQLFNTHLNIWIYRGRLENIDTKHQLQELLNDICGKIYPETPIFINELINKENLSPPINSAKKFLVRAILENESKPNLGFPEERFPPEKAIYISLLRESGIHKLNEEYGYYELSEPIQDSNLYGLWDVCAKFLNSCTATKRNLAELYGQLSKPPLKLKRGFVDFWIPVFLIAKREDYALFHREGGFIPFISDDTIDLINRKTEDFFIKSYDVSGLKINVLEGYKELVQIESDHVGTKTTFLKIFSNFLRFHRGLNNYSLNTKNLSAKASRLRDAIGKAKDPEDALFNEFPTALGYQNISLKEDLETLESYTKQMHSAIREIRSAFDNLLDRVESIIIESFYCNTREFPEYKEEIIAKLEGVDLLALGGAQAVYYKRLTSPLDDRKSWLKSVADVIIGKNIEDLLDVEEHLLINNTKERSLALMKAAEIQQFNKISAKQRMYAFSFYEETGETVHDKLLVTRDRTSIYDEAEKTIGEAIGTLNAEKRKEILLEFLRKEIKRKANAEN